MLPVFRKIRWRHARDNQFLKYSRYAIGEILLIVLGIIIALQLQDWNETRKQEERFKIVLEQIYNSVQADIENFQGRRSRLQLQCRLIDTLLVHPEKFPKEGIPRFLYWIAQDNKRVNSEINFHLSNLEYNTENPEQNELARIITLYVDNNTIYKEILSNDIDMDDQSLWDILQESSVPYPGNISNEIAQEFMHVNENYFSESEIEKVWELIREPRFRSALKSKFNANLVAHLYANNRYEEAVSMSNLIKSYYPEVRILFRDVGIIGSAIDGWVDVSSKPMIQLDIKKNVWETTLDLKEGEVKFRCRDSWSQNWGGSSFPQGEAVWFGGNIRVEPGKYHIVLDLDNNTYSFEKLANE